MFTVGLANHKGGVGKTTNAVNIAGALADRGHDVLLVDCDPQGYLTITLGFRNQYRNGSPTVADALRNPSRVDPGGLVTEHPEFDLVPSGRSLRPLTQTLIQQDTPDFGRVRRLLERVDDNRYDFAVVDTPPVKNAFTDIILADIGDVFVPMEVSEPSVHSIHSLVNYIVDLEQRTGAGTRIQAVLLSDVTYPLDNEQKRVRQWVEENFESRCPVYEIRHRAAIQRSLNDGCSIFGPDAKSTDMKPVYTDIAAQIERLGPREPAPAGGANRDKQ